MGLLGHLTADEEWNIYANHTAVELICVPCIKELHSAVHMDNGNMPGINDC